MAEDIVKGILQICCNESLCKCIATDCCSICHSMPCTIFSHIGSCCCKVLTCCLLSSSSASGTCSDCNCKCDLSKKCSECDQILFTNCVQKANYNTSGVSTWCDWACHGISRSLVRCCNRLNIYTCFGIAIIDINDNGYYGSYGGNNYNSNYNSNIVIINEMGSSGGQKNSNHDTKKSNSTPTATANPECSQIEIQINNQEGEEKSVKEDEEIPAQTPMIKSDESISDISIEIESD